MTPAPTERAADGAPEGDDDDEPDWVVRDEPDVHVDDDRASYVENGAERTDTGDAGWGSSVWGGGDDAPLEPDDGSSAGYDGEMPPPEDVPGGVMEDVGVAYNAPMNVPEPPPLPGILDRFTPPPVQQRDVGGDMPSYLDDMGYSEPTGGDPTGGFGGDRPSYLATPEPGERQESAPVPKVRPSERLDDDDDDDDVIVTRPPVSAVVVAGVAAALFFGIVGIGGLAMVLLTAGGGSAPAETVETRPAQGDDGVEVRNDMRQKPGLIGEAVEEPGDDEPLDDPEGMPDGGAEPEPEPVPEPAPAPEPVPAAPKPAPAPTAPKPRPAPKPAPAAAPAARGTLKIRSNRRVLVYVDDRAVGYAPQDLPASPGEHTVSAMIAGRPASKRNETVKVEAGGTASVDFTF